MKRCNSESSIDQYYRIDNSLNAHKRTDVIPQNEMAIDSSNCEIQLKQKHKLFEHESGGPRNITYNSSISDAIDVAIRIIFIFIFVKLETMQSYKRIIHVEEMWMYKNPRTTDIVSPAVLLISVVFGPFCTTLLHLYLTGDRRDFRAASWTWTLALCLNGMSTSLLKVTIGRPRPDFFYRCFPDGKEVLTYMNDTPNIFQCTGSPYIINEGRKSFPSGHASFAFTGFGFIAFYIGAKLHTFNENGRGETWRLLITLMPLILASLIAISRVCDYHHHFLDVFAGAVIGLLVTYMVYRQYYPSIFSRNSNQPLIRTTHSKKIEQKIVKNKQYIKLKFGVGDHIETIKAGYKPLMSVDDKDIFD